MCSCALLQLKESPGPATPQPVLCCQGLQMVSGSHVGTGWAQAAGWSLLHSLDRPQDRLCQLRLPEQREDYWGAGLQGCPWASHTNLWPVRGSGTARAVWVLCCLPIPVC